LQAAILLPKLEILDDEMVRREQVASRYGALLTELDFVARPKIESHNHSAWAQYTVRVQDRDAVRARLGEVGVPTAVHYPLPLSQQPAVVDVNARVPSSEAAARHVMSLPMSPYLLASQQDFIVAALASSVSA
jgi:UDP-2-acetamido-2-deoxy-ribo-hexuluronate aminotransferase